MKLETEGLELLGKALIHLEKGFADLPDTPLDFDGEKLTDALMEVAEAMRDNYPYFHPLYAGQMIKPPHPVARLAYMLALYVNPNNHALDGGRASSHMEKEAVAEIARMFGWETHLGHLTGGGTMANMEALWVSGSLHPGKLIVASEQAHYTHGRISHVMKLPFHAIETDNRARMDLNHLEDLLKEGNVGTVVATIGTTATGSVDPLPEILSLKEKYGFRIHADAAYGGYYILAENLPEETKRAFQHLHEVDSIAIDPHKHGLQPYGCGCIVFRDPGVGRLYKHDSPYTYFSSKELHLGEISLECSRPGASAVALWATQRMLPLIRGGTFARSLERCREAGIRLYEKLSEDPRFVVSFPPELDIVIWAPRRERISEASEAASEFFEAAAERDLHLALATLPSRFFEDSLQDTARDSETVTCLRSCLMKPEHLDWVERIYEIISDLAS